uniref:DNA-directed RNA polymerases I, II, and III subunit rpabc1 n=2 Tax=Dictyostelium discoideum TaxID=44689 RepID=RPAB1_DICDI|nr:RecName: Full=DNA-directed RNA polymerases I, II, and III subunit rpabc1; Short=RNA polymerases I, II, and III subunit ABC1; AltName: Full=RPB5 homolog [Dictyostelium discoideum]
MEDINRLLQIRKTVLQMLSDREYIITAYEQEYPRESFVSRENLTMYCVKKDDPTDSIYVFFPDTPKVGVTQIKKYVDIMKDRQANRAIIVVQQNITPFAKQALAEFSQEKKITLEQFNEAELLVNITHHQLVPKHILLTKEEKLELLTRYKMKESQLPRIQTNDPVARYYGLSRGHVVKIVRPSETAGRYITYRLCV